MFYGAHLTAILHLIDLKKLCPAGLSWDMMHKADVHTRREIVQQIEWLFESIASEEPCETCQNTDYSPKNSAGIGYEDDLYGVIACTGCKEYRNLEE